MLIDGEVAQVRASLSIDVVGRQSSKHCPLLQVGFAFCGQSLIIGDMTFCGVVLNFGEVVVKLAPYRGGFVYISCHICPSCSNLMGLAG